jgi:hypothetical protein
LNNCPKHTALSYTWGDVKRTRHILVNNKLITVTGSLEVALRHLQKERDTLTLWVNAICINQEDKDEKAEQVLQIMEIYQNATQVVIWLGPAADESDRFIDNLTFIGKEYHKHDLAGITALRLIEIMRDQDDDCNIPTVSSLTKLL